MRTTNQAEIEILTLREIADLVAERKLTVGEIQREFVWDADKAATWLDSAVRHFQLGSVHLHRMPAGTTMTVRVNGEAVVRKLDEQTAILDGQQRISIISMLVNGAAPEWCNPIVAEVLIANVAYDPRADAFTAPAVKGTIAAHEMLRDLADPEASIRQALSDALAGVHTGGVSPNVLDDYTRRALQHRETILGRQISVETAVLGIEDAFESFRRLNTQGVKLEPEDVVLGAIATVYPTFRDNIFMPYVKELDAAGVAGTSKAGRQSKIVRIVLRTLLTALQMAREDHTIATRISDVTLDYSPDDFDVAMAHTRAAWDVTLRYLNDNGLQPMAINSLDTLAPILLFGLRWPRSELFTADDPRMAMLFLLGVRSQRYVKQSTDAHALDARIILGGNTDFEAVLHDLIVRIATTYVAKFNTPVPIYGLRDVLYVPKKNFSNQKLNVAYAIWAARRKSVDWVTGVPVSVQFRRGRAATTGGEYHWHHVVPQAYARNSGINGEWVESLANMALVDGKTNRAFGADAPRVYVADHAVPGDVLDQQFWAEASTCDATNAEQVVLDRAKELVGPDGLNWIFELAYQLAPEAVTGWSEARRAEAAITTPVDA